METNDLPPVLAQFQAATFNNKEMRKLLININNSIGEEEILPEETVTQYFDKFWPELEEKVTRILEGYTYEEGTEESRTSEDMIKEILDLSRSIARGIGKEGEEEEEEEETPPEEDEELPF